MPFIVILMMAATAIAGAAAYFSVYGLAFTFSGVFWSVVVMGASLEAGKLVAASFLYRYWARIGWILKSYLILGVVALMVLTSTGIFGYLSTGYQQDVLPLKQKTEQVRLLEEEKTRVLGRKEQIDTIIAGNSASTNVNTKAGGLDPNAARVLRETSRSRDGINRQYKGEQEQVTKRLSELDTQLLTLKQDLIKQEAHIGPIIFVAQAFNMPTDDATKYLIFLIIFAFDPMAVALTLAVNIAFRLYKQDKVTPLAEEQVLHKPVGTTCEPIETQVIELQPAEFLEDQVETDPPAEPELEEETQGEIDLQPVDGEREMYVAEKIQVDTTTDESPPAPQTLPGRLLRPNISRQFVETPSMEKINELVSYHRFLKARIAKGTTLTDTEMWEFRNIEAILQRNGYDKYM